MDCVWLAVFAVRRVIESPTQKTQGDAQMCVRHISAGRFWPLAVSGSRSPPGTPKAAIAHPAPQEHKHSVRCIHDMTGLPNDSETPHSRRLFISRSSASYPDELILFLLHVASRARVRGGGHVAVDRPVATSQ